MKTSNTALSRQLSDIMSELFPLRPVNWRAGSATSPDLFLRAETGAYVVAVTKSAASSMVVRDAILRVKNHASAVVATLGDVPVVPVIGVPSMGETGQRLCEEAGVGWIDLAGNANIRGPGIVISISGRKPTKRPPATGDNPFAQKSSRVIKRLLSEPQRWISQHELAKESRLDEGYVSKIVRRLEHDRQLQRDPARRLRPRSPDALIDEWRDHYDFGKHHRIAGHVPARSGPELIEMVGEGLRRSSVAHAFTGLAGAWLLTKFANFRLGTVLVEALPSADVLQSIGFRADPRGANLWMVAPTDSDPIISAQTVDGFSCADPIQVYLDLKGHSERAQEAAAEVRRRLMEWHDND